MLLTHRTSAIPLSIFVSLYVSIYEGGLDHRRLTIDPQQFQLLEQPRHLRLLHDEWHPIVQHPMGGADNGLGGVQC